MPGSTDEDVKDLYFTYNYYIIKTLSKLFYIIISKIHYDFSEMPRSKISDLFGIFKGLQSVTNALIKHQEDAIRYRIIYSSLKDLPEKCLQAAGKKLNNIESSKVPVSLVIDIYVIYRLMYVTTILFL